MDSTSSSKLPFSTSSSSFDFNSKQMSHYTKVYQPRGWWLSIDFRAEEITVIRLSFCNIKDRLDSVANTAFEKLFEKQPEFFSLIVGNNNKICPKRKSEVSYSWETREHGLHVLSDIERCLNRIDRRETFADLISMLAARHLSYGATPLFILTLLGCFRSAVIQEFECPADSYCNDDLSDLLTRAEVVLCDVWSKFFNSLGLAITAEMLALKEFIAPPLEPSTSSDASNNNKAKQRPLISKMNFFRNKRN